MQGVGVYSISNDETSQELINMRNRGAMIGSDPSVIRGVAISNVTEGVKNAGSNDAGSMAGFMGVGMGMNAMNATMESVNQMTAGMAGVMPNQQQPVQQPSAQWTCSCGNMNTGKFCSECGQPRP